ncbi:MAG: mannosyltransferase [Solirubrobacteraceae bacterium]|jgi:mannosyltransferase|nr:mannosyltransferase [Solirubrobacteraceae bacterium]
MNAVATPAPSAVRTPARERVRAQPRVRELLIAAAGLSALLGLSLALRTTAIHAPFWIDEGLSVGIASHPFTDIPSVLRQDGSPPLYYLLLHLWIVVFGDGQGATHALSVAFALATVPIAWWGARSMFSRRAGWCAAALAALNPFLTYYAQETRMYALVAVLGLLVAVLHLQVFVFRRRAFVVPFGLALAALVYTHNWGLFMAVGTVAAMVPAVRFAPDRRGVLRDAAIAYGLTGLLYAAWLPSLIFQAGHTGAPWAERPGLGDVLGPITGLLGGQVVPLGLLLAGGAGLATIAQAPPGDAVADRRRAAMWTLVVMPAAALAVAWTASQVSPAYTGRYFAILIGPLLLLAGIGLAHAGRLGLVALAIILALWFDPRTSTISHKSDVRVVAAKVRGSLQAGDLVISVHPEQVPVLHYYFPPNLRWATSLGPMPDPGVFDWRDAQDRLEAARPTPTLNRLVSTMAPGQTLVLALPIIRTGAWGAPWTSLVRRRSSQWQRVADRDPRLVRIAAEPRFGHRRLPRGIRTVLYRVVRP